MPDSIAAPAAFTAMPALEPRPASVVDRALLRAPRLTYPIQRPAPATPTTDPEPPAQITALDAADTGQED